MKPLAFVSLAAALIGTSAAPPQQSNLRFERIVSSPAGQTVCALLDAAVFAHASPTLADLRLSSASGEELPYAVTLSRTSETGDRARILNLGQRGFRHLSFNLQMPARPYSSLNLGLNVRDFLASAKVSGMSALNDRAPVLLGTYTVFDLTSQHLGASSSLSFAESTFPYLQVDLDFTPAPGNDTLVVTPALVSSAEVPPSRQAQTLYAPLAEVVEIAQRPRESVATFNVPAHVPIERVSFVLNPGDRTNFSRSITINARPTIAREGETASEQLSGEISRVRLTEAGQEIDQQLLSIPAILGSNEQVPVTVEVAIQNGDDRPVPLRAVRLEMRERKLCYEAPQSSPAVLRYGDPGLQPPVYDFGRLFNVSQTTQAAVLGPEMPNPRFVPHTAKLSLMERYPQLLWLALLAVVGALGVVAFRAARKIN